MRALTRPVRPLTEPMLIVLVAMAARAPGWYALYPAGQRRLILQGLLDRDLIASDLGLTTRGMSIVALVRGAEVVDADG